MLQNLQLNLIVLIEVNPSQRIRSYQRLKCNNIHYTSINIKVYPTLKDYINEMWRIEFSLFHPFPKTSLRPNIFLIYIYLRVVYVNVYKPQPQIIFRHFTENIIKTVLYIITIIS